MIPPLPSPLPAPPTFPVSGQGQKSLAFHQSTILAEFFSLTSTVIQLLYKACFLSEGIYNLLEETKFVKQIEAVRDLTCVWLL